MLAMDVSDVYYDKFLINGKMKVSFRSLRLEIRYDCEFQMQELHLFGLTLRRGKITVVANDGNDVEPVEVDRLIIGVSETYVWY
jgi:FtsP/CotA-like multicopper oxidase with cupredoxin domain